MIQEEDSKWILERYKKDVSESMYDGYLCGVNACLNYIRHANEVYPISSENIDMILNTVEKQLTSVTVEDLVDPDKLAS